MCCECAADPVICYDMNILRPPCHMASIRYRDVIDPCRKQSMHREPLPHAIHVLLMR